MMGELLMEYAVADQDLHTESKNTAQDRARDMRRDKGFFSPDAREARRSRRKTKRESDLRGHAVEWASRAFRVSTSQGSFIVIAAPLPGPSSDLKGAASISPWEAQDIRVSLGLGADATIERYALVHTHQKNFAGRMSAEFASGRGPERGDVDNTPSTAIDAIVSPTGRVRQYTRDGAVLPKDVPITRLKYETISPSLRTRERIERLRQGGDLQRFQRALGRER